MPPHQTIEVLRHEQIHSCLQILHYFFHLTLRINEHAGDALHVVRTPMGVDQGWFKRLESCRVSMAIDGQNRSP